MQIWLRPNVRILWLQIVAALAALLMLGMVLVWGAWSRQPLAIGVAGLLGAGAAWQLTRRVRRLRTPRLAYQDGWVLVATSASGHVRLPLEAVECFFLGCGEADLASRPPASRNLVIRLAEGASPWHRHPMDHRLGRWCDGYITLYGLWCEPLDVQQVRQLNHLLAAAKRASRKG